MPDSGTTIAVDRRIQVMLGRSVITEVISRILSVLYNLPKQSTRFSQMQSLGHCGPNGRQWRWLLILIATLSLGVSLATRFAVPITSRTDVVKSVSRCLIQPQRQRLNRDAVQWAAPVQVSEYVEHVIFYPRLTPSESRFTIQFFDDSQHNRPPPSSPFSL